MDDRLDKIGVPRRGFGIHGAVLLIPPRNAAATLCSFVSLGAIGLFTNVLSKADLSPFMAEFGAIAGNCHSGLRNASTLIPASNLRGNTLSRRSVEGPLPVCGT